MQDDRRKAIEARAYHLWEETGHPHGMQDEHWRQAEREFDEAVEATTSRPEDREVEDKPTDNITSLSHRGTDARKDASRRRK